MIEPVAADKLCRSCATTVGEKGQEEAFKHFQKFRDLYSTLSDLKVYDDDDLPKLFCPTCVGLLETIESFKEACARSVDSIRKLIIANLKEEPMMEIVSAEALEPILKIENEQDENAEKKPTRVKKPPNDKKFICALCGKAFANISRIRCHMNSELKRAREEELADDNVPAKTIPKTLYCKHEGCGRWFINQKNLDKHLKMHQGPKMSTWCSTCNRGFVGAGHYIRHMEMYHKAKDLSNLSCTTCNRSFANVIRLKAHIKHRHPDQADMFSCETCGVRYATEYELKTHSIRNHGRYKHYKYLCHYCGKGHKTKMEVQVHLISKHSDPVYEACPICGDQVLQTKLILHNKLKHFVRTNLQIIKCEVCDKEFKRKTLLRRHLKIHTGERPHVCHQCGMTFNRQHTLKNHLFVHTGERPVHCDICGKGLYSKRALEIHMNVHKREWIAQGQTGIELMVYATSNKSKNSTEKKYANLKQPRT